MFHSTTRARLLAVTVSLLVGTAAVGALLGASLVPAGAGVLPIEPLAQYEPQTRCSPVAKPGTKVLGHWIVYHFGGGYGGISRPCGSGGTSEHKEGRAFDWTLDATRAADRARASAFMAKVLAPDAVGDQDALARRMGIMYVIWNDHIYASYDQFRPRPYLDASCRTLAHCSKTLRHRDHLHISLTRRGGRGWTSWFIGRVPGAAAPTPTPTPTPTPSPTPTTPTPTGTSTGWSGHH